MRLLPRKFERALQREIESYGHRRGTGEPFDAFVAKASKRTVREVRGAFKNWRRTGELSYLHELKVVKP